MSVFIVIECFDPEWPNICVNPEDGKPLVFETRKAAKKEADDCQEGLVIQISW